MEQVRLAELVAGKLCHDFMGPMTAMMHGLELLKQAPGGDAEALSLLENGVVKAHAKLDFYRHSLGGALGGEGDTPLSAAMPAAQNLYSTFKAELDWQGGDLTLPRAVIRVVLNILMIANECLPKGGKVRLEAEGDEIRITATGEKARLRAEIATGLAGGVAEDGMASLYIMPLMTALLARQAGVALTTSEAEGGFVFTLTRPSRTAE
jgi:histidine phosphotransferase ChpT